MHFDEREEGGYRIYAGALEPMQGAGYVAAAVISRLDASGQREAWRDTSMSGGHRWHSPDDALRYAFARATEVIRTEPEKLACRPVQRGLQRWSWWRCSPSPLRWCSPESQRCAEL